jgi:DNA-binding transcriptional regulator YiaG
MNTIEYIRHEVLGGISQAELAAIADTSQPTVSRWEAGDLEPDRRQLGLIRRAVLKRGLQWDDSWFFEIPHGAKS